MRETPLATAASSKLTLTLKLRQVATYPGIRVLAWEGETLYACRGYQIVRMQPGIGAEWTEVARFHPAWWRDFTSRAALTSRLTRDGFHALVILRSSLRSSPGSAREDQNDSHTLVGAVPGAVVTRVVGSDEFQVSHRVGRGTRPLHITAEPSGRIYWGEYFDNRERAEVHVYVSADRGRTWHVAYTFPAGSIRHVHNIVYDRWGDCLWILTGDEGAECKVLRASCDLRAVEVVLSGDQQGRTVAAIPTPKWLYFSTDTPFEKNHVYRLDRSGNVERVGDLASSSIFGCSVGCGVGCQTGEAIIFSTMVEPSTVNTSSEVQIAGSSDGTNWQVLARWKKDVLPMRYFQYGNAILPDGVNATHYLAATTIAVETDDLVTTVWEVELA